MRINLPRDLEAAEARAEKRRGKVTLSASEVEREAAKNAERDTRTVAEHGAVIWDEAARSFLSDELPLDVKRPTA